MRFPMLNRLSFSLLIFLTSTAAFAQTQTAIDWQPVVPGVDYVHVVEGSMDIHAVRVDLTNQNLRIVSSRQSDAGIRVSDFARRTHAIAAINGDYFDSAFRPIGLVVGPCGQWQGSKDTAREGVVAFGAKRAEIHTQSEVMDPPEPWISAAVSGWPMLVRDCHALTSAELPGSDSFTRAPHARTAVGESKDGTTFYFVVADGGRADAPGLTLGQLSAWMSDRLGVCSAINLDGGGSSAMWVGDRIVNRPSDGTERPVGDHLAVVTADATIACDMDKEQRAGNALLAASAKAAAAANNAKATITVSTPAPQPTTTTTTAPPPR